VFDSDEEMHANAGLDSKTTYARANDLRQQRSTFGGT
jgi:hypothetical protein